jgi:hypothetical protein
VIRKTYGLEIDKESQADPSPELPKVLAGKDVSPA